MSNIEKLDKIVSVSEFDIKEKYKSPLYERMDNANFGNYYSITNFLFDGAVGLCLDDVVVHKKEIEDDFRYMITASNKFYYISKDVVFVLINGCNICASRIGKSPKDNINVYKIAIFAKDKDSLKQGYEKLKPFLYKLKPKKKDDSYSIHLLVKDMSQIALQQHTIKNRYKINLDKHYNDGFREFDNRVQYSIMNENSGLFILHGEPGTGKTSYIKYLSKKLQDDKKFIFIPSHFVDALSDPSFIGLMLNNPNSVLIVEDAERGLKSREGNRSNAVSNILNVTDGILGDAIKSHVICTINCGLKDIDKALLRSGRNKGVYEFKPLQPDKVEQLGVSPKKPMTLGDIYNESGGEIEEKRKIGFQ